MKPRVVVPLSLLLVILIAANLLPSHAQKATETPQVNAPPPLSNPLKVALLKWYQANETTLFTVGAGPVGVTFDGANIWVASNDTGAVSKIRANDGAPLGTVNVTHANGICFDGANVWVTSAALFDRKRGVRRSETPSSDNTVTKIRASDGKVLGVFTVGDGPWWPTFDGQNIWIPNGADNTVTKLRAGDGTVLGTFNVGVSPFATAFDGSAIWVTNFTGTSSLGTVTKLRTSDGKVLGTFTVGYGPYGIAFDGAYMWIANANSNSVSKLRASDGAVIGTFTIAGNEVPTGVAFDGANIWITGAALIELSGIDGKELLALPQPGNESGGLAFDGANIWVALTNASQVGKL